MPRPITAHVVAQMGHRSQGIDIADERGDQTQYTVHLRTLDGQDVMVHHPLVFRTDAAIGLTDEALLAVVLDRLEQQIATDPHGKQHPTIQRIVAAAWIRYALQTLKAIP